MGQITSGVGLITGFPITDTVDKLMALAAKPRDTLKTKVDTLTTQQNTYTAISAGVLKLDLTALKLGNANIFDQRSGTSSNSNVIKVATSGFPATGSYQFTALRQASSQQLLSTGFAGSDSLVGAGTLSFRFGGAIDKALSLSSLNGGTGVPPGSVKITDRSGQSAIIDLRAARTIDDVIDAVNTNTDINVKLTAAGDHLVLTDLTGDTSSNLRVQNVGGGTTATALGLGSVNVAANSATGGNIVTLDRDVLLSALNDGNGIRNDGSLSDLRVTFHDGSTPLNIELTDPGTPGGYATTTTKAAAGLNGQLVFTAKNTGPDYSGYQITFQDDGTVTQGNEKVVFDSAAKKITFKIKEGVTTAADLVTAFNRNAAGSTYFSIGLPPGSTGFGAISSNDGGVTDGPQAVGVTGGTNANSTLVFTAVTPGSDYSGVDISFVVEPTVVQGQEIAAYSQVDPENKKLTFSISAASTANDIIAALARNSIASQYFTVHNDDGSTGNGIVVPADGVTTTGGKVAETIPAKTPSTVGDLLDLINEADPTRLKAQIAADGKRIELVDLTVGANPFTVVDTNNSHVAADLGLTGAEVAGVISGRRVLSGLTSPLLTSLNGGKGFGQLGQVKLTDRSGATATVNLASAVTLEDVLNTINGAGVGIQAEINSAKNGIVLEDTTGQTAGNLKIENDDATNTAEKLGIAENDSVSYVNSGSLNLQVFNENTTLASLNGGKGIASGRFTIYSTSTASGVVDLTTGKIKTVGDLLSAINKLSIGVTAQINDAGDGFELVDTIGGTAALRVAEGNSTAAADLNLLGTSTTRIISGNERQVLGAATTRTITLTDSDTVQDLVDKINQLNAGVSAATLNTGDGANPFRIAINSQRSGRAGNLVIDASQVAFGIQETARGQDAVLQLGSGAASTISTSNTDDFANILPGVNLTLAGVSNTAVNVSIASSSSGASDAIQALVNAYNGIWAQIADATKFSPPPEGSDDAPTTGPLYGQSTILSVETRLSSVLSTRFFSTGAVQSLEAVGIQLQDDGTLKFDSSKFGDAVDANPEGVKDFFTKTDFGFVDQLRNATKAIATNQNALIVTKLDALSTNITNNNDKIDDWNKRLDVQKNALLLKFYNMDTLIGKLQSSAKVVSGIQNFLVSTPTNSNGSSN